LGIVAKAKALAGRDIDRETEATDEEARSISGHHSA